MIYKELSNRNFKNDNVPSILKPVMVSRKFVVDRTLNNAILQFGSGKAGATDVVASPQSVAVDIFGKDYTTDTSFDPTKISKNENFGIVPANTDLTIVYRATNPMNSNTAVGSLNGVSSLILNFSDMEKLSATKTSAIKNSIEVFNETPITGDTTNPSAAEIKQRIYDTFPTQNRAVTQADYESIAYRMPGKFGSVLRVSAQKDPSSAKRNLNLYVVSENSKNQLELTNQTIKNNLKTWLNQYRMMNDTIDILDPYIINIGISFNIKATAGVEKYAAMESAVDAVRKNFNTKFFIGEPLNISEIYKALKEIPAVLDVIDVKVFNKNDSNYSGNILNIAKNMSPDGGSIITPKNAILEIKFPEVDIKGRIS